MDEAEEDDDDDEVEEIREGTDAGQMALRGESNADVFTGTKGRAAKSNRCEINGGKFLKHTQTHQHNSLSEYLSH
jgi:hypothetical protein